MASSRYRSGYVALIGRPNAGKSTLLNTLTSSEVLAEDKLFATLDPTTRRLRFPREREVVIADTVGFIRDLPQDLAQAFRATLEELDQADLLLHLVDASDPDHEQQIAAVERILNDLGLGETPRMLVLNKLDLLPLEDQARLLADVRTVAVSARDPSSIDPLMTALEATLWRGAHAI